MADGCKHGIIGACTRCNEDTSRRSGEEAAFHRGSRRGYTDGYFAAEVAARPVLQDALDMLRTERYGNTDPDKRERTIERIERFMKGAPGVVGQKGGQQGC